MERNLTQDWVVALLTLFFLFIPVIGALFRKKKIPPRPQKEKIMAKEISTPKKNKPLRPPPSPSQNPSIFDEPLIEKEKQVKLKYGSLQDAVILSEILNRPYKDK